MNFKNISFLFVFSAFLFGASFYGLEKISEKNFKKRLKNSLSIFVGILSSKENVLDIKPKYDGTWKGQGFSVKVKTNSRGYRENFNFEDSTIDVAFVGDSFTFGHGVNVNDRFTNIAASRFQSLQIASLSYNNGFQPEHYEYFLNQHPEIKPKVLFISLYLGNDFDSDLAETIISRDSSGNLKNLQIPYRSIYQNNWINKATYRFPWFTTFVEQFYLGKMLAVRINASPKLRNIFVSEQKIIPNTPNRLSTELGKFDNHNRRVFTSLNQITQIMKRRQCNVQVLIIPQNFIVGAKENPHLDRNHINKMKDIIEANGLTKRILEECKANNWSCHDLAKLLNKNDYIKKDAHWNKKGHLKTGDYVGNLIDSILHKSNFISKP